MELGTVLGGLILLAFILGIVMFLDTFVPTYKSLEFRKKRK